MEKNSKNTFKRQVLRDKIADFLLDAIINGRYDPGDKVVETQISKELGVSQGGVREAILDLTARGVLVSEPYKGTRVRSVDVGELRDYYRMRGELEHLALTWAFGEHEGRLLDVDRLTRLVDEMQVCAKNNDGAAMRKLDMEFHALIVEGAGSTSLLKCWNSLGNSFWFCIGISHAVKSLSLVEQAQRHIPIAKAIKEMDPDKAFQIVRDHYSQILSQL